MIRPHLFILLCVTALLPACKGESKKRLPPATSPPTARAARVGHAVTPSATTLPDGDLPAPTRATASQPDSGPVRSPDDRWDAYSERVGEATVLHVRPVQPSRSARPSVALRSVRDMEYFWIPRPEGTLLAINTRADNDDGVCLLYSPVARRSMFVYARTLADFSRIDVAHLGFTRRQARILAASPNGLRLLLEMRGSAAETVDRRFYSIRTDSGQVVVRFDDRDRIPRDWWRVEPPAPAPATRPDSFWTPDTQPDGPASQPATRGDDRPPPRRPRDTRT